MKFAVVEIGQRFKFKDEFYIKSSPLVANNEESGQQKLFRRADNVEPDNKAIPQEPVSKSTDRDAVMNSFERFYLRCIDSLDEHLSGDLADEKNALFTALEEAKQGFVEDFKKLE